MRAKGVPWSDAVALTADVTVPIFAVKEFIIIISLWSILWSLSPMWWPEWSSMMQHLSFAPEIQHSRMVMVYIGLYWSILVYINIVVYTLLLVFKSAPLKSPIKSQVDNDADWCWWWCWCWWWSKSTLTSLFVLSSLSNQRLLKSPIRSQADNALRIKSSSTTVEEVDPTIMIEHRLPTISDLFSNLTKITAVPVYITKQSSQSQSATPNWWLDSNARRFTRVWTNLCNFE